MKTLHALFAIIITLGALFLPFLPQKEILVKVKYMAYACEPSCDDFMVLDVATGSNKVKTTVDIAVIYKGNNLEEGLNGLPLHPGQVLIIKGVTPKSSFLRRFILGEKLVYASYVMPKL